MNSQAFSEWLTVVLYIGENHGNSADLRRLTVFTRGTFSTLVPLTKPSSPMPSTPARVYPLSVRRMVLWRLNSCLKSFGNL